VTGATCLGQVGLWALPVIAVLLAEQHRHPAAAGWLLTSVAAGGLVGSLAWTWRPAAPEHAPTVVMGGLAAAGVPLAVAAVLPSGLQVTAVLFAVSGLSTGPLFGALLMTRHHHAPAAARTQVFTLGAGAKITATAAGAGAAVAGTLAGHTTAALLLLAGSCPVAAGVLGQLSLTAHRRTRCAAADPSTDLSRSRDALEEPEVNDPLFGTGLCSSLAFSPDAVTRAVGRGRVARKCLSWQGNWAC